MTVKIIDDAYPVDTTNRKVDKFITFIRNNQMLTIGIIGTIVIILIGIFAPLITPFDPLEHSLRGRLLPPGDDGHLLGTDQFGRDVFTRIIYAIRIDLTIGFLGVLFPLIIGVLLGSVAGFFGEGYRLLYYEGIGCIYSLPLPDFINCDCGCSWTEHPEFIYCTHSFRMDFVCPISQGGDPGYP